MPTPDGWIPNATWRTSIGLRPVQTVETSDTLKVEVLDADGITYYVRPENLTYD